MALPLSRKPANLPSVVGNYTVVPFDIYPDGARSTIQIGFLLTIPGLVPTFGPLPANLSQTSQLGYGRPCAVFLNVDLPPNSGYDCLY